MSTIASNLASVLAGLNAGKTNPKQDPAAALRRLNLPGKAHEPYVDVVHFGATDLAVVTRALDDEREQLEQASAQAGQAIEALTSVEALLSEATELVNTNAKGAARGRRRSNQRKVDELLARIDETLAAANKASPDLFAGSITLSAGNASAKIDAISRDDLGTVTINGRVLNLSDVGSRGTLDSARRRSAAQGALRSLGVAIETVTDLREQIQAFADKDLRPRIGDVATAVAGIFSARGDSLGSSEAALQTAWELRAVTLASSTAAIAVGAEGWDRERVLDLLT